MNRHLWLKIVALSLLLVWVGVTNLNNPVLADSNPCTSCAVYGNQLCCQTFYYTPAGWVPLSDPTWDPLFPD